ncbi:hypothetical protein [Methanooceanicella nereidis]|uniref:hypothetical protein n=1 Tax=Methanooceanicella nereidis TaxID=2052831 RepID=UPI001E5238A5|nr:hypothetical protein [Methanocella sp. CWC-04]
MREKKSIKNQERKKPIGSHDLLLFTEKRAVEREELSWEDEREELYRFLKGGLAAK